MATEVGATAARPARLATARLSGRGSGPFRLALLQILMLSVGIAYVAWALVNPQKIPASPTSMRVNFHCETAICSR